MSTLRRATDAPDLPQRSYKVYPNSGTNHYCKRSRRFVQTNSTNFNDNVQCKESNLKVSDWLPLQYDHPFNGGDVEVNGNEHIGNEDISMFLHEALEACDEFNCSHRTERRNFEQELIFKINEILKTEEGRALHAPRDIILRQTEDSRISRETAHPHNDLPQSSDYSTRGISLSHDGEVVIDDDIHKNSCRNDQRSPIPSQENYGSNVNKRHIDNMLHRGDSYMVMKEQFAAVSLEYWGGHSIDSVEHTLSQSEWFGSPKWQQPLSNQQDWFNNGIIQSPDQMLYDDYAYV
ncbi:9968_t:CDS:2 [Acaulospora colombiana]|uniref:9968_t:CDS:1 n=1 Tax=Acaulospora colombiana TaxID=27376 RepID=A0ACA9KW74_9GLOM|nr:9968_t:CDS:2 [Acaulospora colombiana]